MFGKKEDIEILKSNIFVNLATTTKEEAIRFCGNKLVEAGYVDEEYIESMLNRERMLNTYIDYGIAIPHGDRESQELILKSGLIVAQYKNGINFGDDKTAEVLIATAGKGNNHLRILSGIATISKDPSLIDKLITTNDPQDILNVLDEFIK
ncbi:MAG: PTS sugar transporter subunit IIA [Tissierellia bacterium]|nr:PTS sugar transporter subunit IIA [Tissierellia bacterium]